MTDMQIQGERSWVKNKREFEITKFELAGSNYSWKEPKTFTNQPESKARKKKSKSQSIVNYSSYLFPQLWAFLFS